MLIGLIGLLTLLSISNMIFYEYRVIKLKQPLSDITDLYGKLIISRKYFEKKNVEFKE